MSTSAEQFVSDWIDRPVEAPVPDPPVLSEFQRRALVIWPGLDRTRLRRTHGDPWKIARLVANRSSLPLETILVLIMGLRVADGGRLTS